MSSFSSVIQKPGRKIVPRAAPRRNVQRRVANTDAVIQESPQQSDTGFEDTSPQIEVPAQLKQTKARSEHASNESTKHSASTQLSVEPPPSVEANQGRLSSPSAVQTYTPLGSQNSIQEEEIERDVCDEAEFAALPQVDASSMTAPPLQGLEEQAIRDAPSQTWLTPVSEKHVEPSSAATQQSSAETTSGARTSPSTATAALTQASPRPRKKRKTNPRAAPGLALSLSTPVRTALPSPTSVASPPAEHRDSEPHAYDTWLTSATQGLTSVSEIAKSIDPRTHLTASRTVIGLRAAESQISEDSFVRSTRGQKRKETVEEQAAEVVANAVGKTTSSFGQRGVTPEDAEEYQLEPAKVRMGDLCEDNKLGKKSALEIEMQANWPEILQRRKEDRERALANAEKRRRKGMGQRPLLDINQEPVAALAPAMAVVNGVIVVDQASREIDRSAQLQQAAVQDLDNVREDRDYYKYVNQGTVGVKPGHGQHSKWDEDLTERFFKGLRMFGTDFLMIANMFPGLTRKQIKAKFIREENADKARVRECLLNREPIELEDYAQMANKEAEEFHTLESIQKELDEQERQLREEDNERRKREGFATTANADDPERAATEVPVEGDERQTESIEPGRFDAAAAEIVQAALGSKKRQRKSTVTNSRRGARGGRRPEGGIEEILGSISEVAV